MQDTQWRTTLTDRVIIKRFTNSNSRSQHKDPLMSHFCSTERGAWAAELDLLVEGNILPVDRLAKSEKGTSNILHNKRFQISWPRKCLKVTQDFMMSTLLTSARSLVFLPKHQNKTMGRESHGQWDQKWVSPQKSITFLTQIKIKQTNKKNHVQLHKFPHCWATLQTREKVISWIELQ